MGVLCLCCFFDVVFVRVVCVLYVLCGVGVVCVWCFCGLHVCVCVVCVVCVWCVCRVFSVVCVCACVLCVR